MIPGSIFRNGSIKNVHFAFQRSDWLEHQREEQQREEHAVPDT